MERFLRSNFFTDEEQNAKIGKRVRTTNTQEWRGLPPGTRGKVVRSENFQSMVINKTEVHYIEIEFYNLPRRRKPIAYALTKREYEQYIEEV